MNSNPLQSWLLIFNTVMGVIIAALLNMGCTEAADAISCTASHAPTWLIPYLAYVTGAVNIAKVLIGIFAGKMFTPTVVVSPTGKAGTVTADQVAK